MLETLTFLHTSGQHVQTFDWLLEDMKTQVPVRHCVDESLLQEAKEAGEVTPEIKNRTEIWVRSAAAEGAKVILCTCSTVGGCAEAMNEMVEPEVIRVDRPMADRAVKTATRITLIATLASTLAPTRELLLDSARNAGRQVSITEWLLDAAWRKFEKGDREGYLQEIAGAINRAETDAEVYVLAQASMMGVERLCQALPVPVLSSPRLGLEAALLAGNWEPGNLPGNLPKT